MLETLRLHQKLYNAALEQRIDGLAYGVGHLLN
jgi:hypothetical protein